MYTQKIQTFNIKLETLSANKGEVGVRPPMIVREDSFSALCSTSSQFGERFSMADRSSLSVENLLPTDREFIVIIHPVDRRNFFVKSSPEILLIWV